MSVLSKIKIKKIIILLLFLLAIAIIVFQQLQIENLSDGMNNLYQESVDNSEDDSRQDDAVKNNNNQAFNYNLPMLSKKALVSNGIADLAERVNPSIVNISVVKVLKTQQLDIPFESLNPALKKFFRDMIPAEPEEKKFVNLGSGFVIKEDGFIATNNHVVEGAEKIQVTFDNGDQYEAKLYATDPVTDIAVLKIDAKDLQALKFADSSDAKVGDFVIAVGNPFGLSGTVSFGIISAISRDINIGPYNDFIQTDAAINKGNSGGPMINMKGQVVGINTAIFSTQGGGNIGIGFAVPSNTVKNVIMQLIEHKKVVRGWLGVQIQQINENIAESLSLDSTNGALIAKVLPDSPASKAGIKTGDVIIAVDGKVVESSRQLPKLISAIKPGSEIKLEVIRDGEKIVVDLLVENIPENLQPGNDDKFDDNKKSNLKVKEVVIKDIGLKIVEINDSVRQTFKMDKDKNGVFITGVKKDSIAYEKGLRAGLLIVRINQSKIDGIQDVIDVLKKADKNGILLLVEDLKQNRLFISITKDEFKEYNDNK